MATTQRPTVSAGEAEHRRSGGGRRAAAEPERAAGRGRLRPVVLVVLAAVALGAGLRAPMAQVGLPYLRDPDEPLAPRVSSRMVVDERINAGYYNYPGLMFDLGAIVLLPFVDDDTPLAAAEHPVAATQTQGNGVSDRPGVMAALRWTVGVVPGLVAVAAAGIVAWLATRRWWAAGLAAGLTALSPLDLLYGRYVTPNALAGATSGLVVLAASWLLVSSAASPGWRRPLGEPATSTARHDPEGEPAPSPADQGSSLLGRRRRDGSTTAPPGRIARRSSPRLTGAPIGLYLVAGGAVGLAAAAKYNAVLAAVSVVVAHVLATSDPAQPPSGPSGWRGWTSWSLWRAVLRRSWLLLVAGVACLVVFLALNPGAVIDEELFVDGVRFESEHYRSGHPGNEGDALRFHLSALWDAFGPALLLTPLGLLARDRRARRVALVAWSFVVPYVAFISSFEVRFARNLLPVTAPLAACTALGAVAVVGHARHLRATRAQRATASGPIAAGPAAPPVAGSSAGLGAGLGAGGAVAADGARGAARAPGRARLAGAGAGLAIIGVVAVLAWPALEARAVLDEALPDPWAPAQRWLESHVPDGEPVAVEAYGVFVDPERYEVLTAGSLVEGGHDAAWYRDRGYALLVASERNYQRFLDEPDRFAPQATAYRALLDETCTRFAAGPDDQRVLLLDPSCTDPRST